MAETYGIGRYIRIEIMSAINRAGLHDWCRVQVVGTHAIDNEARLLGKLIELARVELNYEDI